MDIARQKKIFSRERGRCELCMEEKIAILEEKEFILLNSRRELFVKCSHERNYIIGYKEYGEDQERKERRVTVEYENCENTEMIIDL